jgi:hypothetical protein
VHFQSAAVELFRAELLVLLDVLADLLGEVRADARRLLLERAEGDGRADGLPVLLGVDELLREHAPEDVVAAHPGAVGMREGAVVHRRADQRRQHRRLGKGQLFGVLAEVEARARLDPVRAVAEVDLVRVQLEDLVLGEVLLDLHGQEGLVDLAADGLLGGEEDLLGELLGERRGALGGAALDDVLQQRAHDRLRVDAAVAVELRVLGGDDGVDEDLGHVALGDDDALLDRVLRVRHAVAVVDAGDDGGLVVGQLLDLRHPHRVREEEAGRDAQGAGREQQEQPGAASRGRCLREELMFAHCL